MAKYRTQEEINAERNKADMEARMRRLDSRALFVRANPGSVSPFERRELNNWEQFRDLSGRDARLQEHEMNMLKQKGANDMGVAKENAEGLRNQGLEAAKAKAAGDLAVAETQGKTTLSTRERELATQEKTSEMEHGSYDANGNYRPGSRVLTEQERNRGALNVEREKGEWSVKQQEKKNEGLLEQNNLQWQQKQAEIAAKLKEAAIQSQGKIDAAKIGAYSKEVSSAITAGAMRGKDAATVLAELRAAHKDDPGWNAALAALGGGQQQGGKKVRSYRYNADRTKRVPVYEDGSQGPAEDVK